MSPSFRACVRKGADAPRIAKRVNQLGLANPRGLDPVVMDLIDRTLFHLLRSIEQHETIDICIRGEGGEMHGARERRDALAGELWGKSGWTARFSAFGCVDFGEGD